MTNYLKWGAFARVTVQKLARVQPGEAVLVLADTWTDPIISQAVMQAALDVGADAQLIIFPWQSQTDPHEFGPILAGAMRGSQVIIGLCETIFSPQQACKDARKAGARVLSTVPKGIEDYVIEGIVNVDYDGMVENGKIMAALFEQTKICRVTCDLGTDVSFSLAGRPALVGAGIADAPGKMDFFPGVQVNIAPVEETINGVVVIDGSISPGGIVSSPVKVTLENGVMTKIEGGIDASSWKARLDATGDLKIFELCHMSIGLNPRARMSGNMIEDERVVGCVDFGFGNQDPAFKGTVGSSRFHVDVVLASPTISLDGVVMAAKNKLNLELGFLDLK